MKFIEEKHSDGPHVIIEYLVSTLGAGSLLQAYIHIINLRPQIYSNIFNFFARKRLDISSLLIQIIDKSLKVSNVL